MFLCPNQPCLVQQVHDELNPEQERRIGFDPFVFDKKTQRGTLIDPFISLRSIMINIFFWGSPLFLINGHLFSNRDLTVGQNPPAGTPVNNLFQRQLPFGGAFSSPKATVAFDSHPYTLDETRLACETTDQ